MSTIITQSDFIRLFQKNLRDVAFNKYNSLPKMRDKFYNILPSDSSWEEFFDVGNVPDIPSGSSVTYLSVSPGFHTKIEPGEFSGGLQFQRKFLDDKKYNVFNSQTEGLAMAADRTAEKKAVAPFANPFSTAYDYMTSEEGVSLCSSSHTTKSGTSTASGFDNAGSSAMDKDSVFATWIAMRQFRDDISERIDTVDDKYALVYPSNLAGTAHEIVKTIVGLDVTSQNANFLHNKLELIEYPRLDDYDSNNWGMVNLTKMKQSLLWIDRIKPEFNTNVDFQTYVTQVSCYMRFGYGWRDWRWIMWHNVS